MRKSDYVILCRLLADALREGWSIARLVERIKVDVLKGKV